MSPDFCTFSLLLYVMVLKTISPGSGVQVSPMQCFYSKTWILILHMICMRAVIDSCDVNLLHLLHHRASVLQVKQTSVNTRHTIPVTWVTSSC